MTLLLGLGLFGAYAAWPTPGGPGTPTGWTVTADSLAPLIHAAWTDPSHGAASFRVLDAKGNVRAEPLAGTTAFDIAPLRPGYRLCLSIVAVVGDRVSPPSPMLCAMTARLPNPPDSDQAARVAADPSKPRYNAVIGEGCGGSIDGVATGAGNYWPVNTSLGQDWKWDETGGYVSGADRCYGKYRTHATAVGGTDTFTWQFDTGLAASSCTVAVYIPNAPALVTATKVTYIVNGGGTNTTNNVGRAVSTGATVTPFTVDQRDNLGRWLTLGPFALNAVDFGGGVTGRVNLVMYDYAGYGSRVAAGPARLVCV